MAERGYLMSVSYGLSVRFLGCLYCDEKEALGRGEKDLKLMSQYGVC